MKAIKALGNKDSNKDTRMTFIDVVLVSALYLTSYKLVRISYFADFTFIVL